MKLRRIAYAIKWTWLDWYRLKLPINRANFELNLGVFDATFK